MQPLLLSSSQNAADPLEANRSLPQEDLFACCPYNKQLLSPNPPG